MTELPCLPGPLPLASSSLPFVQLMPHRPWHLSDNVPHGTEMQLQDPHLLQLACWLPLPSSRGSPFRYRRFSLPPQSSVPLRVGPVCNFKSRGHASEHPRAPQPYSYARVHWARECERAQTVHPQFSALPTLTLQLYPNRFRSVALQNAKPTFVL